MRLLFFCALFLGSLLCFTKEAPPYPLIANEPDKSSYEIYSIEDLNTVVIDANTSTHISELENSKSAQDFYFSDARNFIYSLSPSFRLWDTETGKEHDVRCFLRRILWESNRPLRI